MSAQYQRAPERSRRRASKRGRGASRSAQTQGKQNRAAILRENLSSPDASSELALQGSGFDSTVRNPLLARLRQFYRGNGEDRGVSETNRPVSRNREIGRPEFDFTSTWTTSHQPRALNSALSSYTRSSSHATNAESRYGRYTPDFVAEAARTMPSSSSRHVQSAANLRGASRPRETQSTLRKPSAMSRIASAPALPKRTSVVGAQDQSNRHTAPPKARAESPPPPPRNPLRLNVLDHSIAYHYDEDNNEVNTPQNTMDMFSRREAMELEEALMRYMQSKPQLFQAHDPALLNPISLDDDSVGDQYHQDDEDADLTKFKPSAGFRVNATAANRLLDEVDDAEGVLLEHASTLAHQLSGHCAQHKNVVDALAGGFHNLLFLVVSQLVSVTGAARKLTDIVDTVDERAGKLHAAWQRRLERAESAHAKQIQQYEQKLQETTRVYEERLQEADDRANNASTLIRCFHQIFRQMKHSHLNIIDHEDTTVDGPPTIQLVRELREKNSTLQIEIDRALKKLYDAEERGHMLQQQLGALESQLTSRENPDAAAAHASTLHTQQRAEFDELQTQIEVQLLSKLQVPLESVSVSHFPPLSWVKETVRSILDDRILLEMAGNIAHPRQLQPSLATHTCTWFHCKYPDPETAVEQRKSLYSGLLRHHKQDSELRLFLNCLLGERLVKDEGSIDRQINKLLDEDLSRCIMSTEVLSILLFCVTFIRRQYRLPGLSEGEHIYVGRKELCDCIDYVFQNLNFTAAQIQKAKDIALQYTSVRGSAGADQGLLARRSNQRPSDVDMWQSLGIVAQILGFHYFNITQAALAAIRSEFEQRSLQIVQAADSSRTQHTFKLRPNAFQEAISCRIQADADTTIQLYQECLKWTQVLISCEHGVDFGSIHTCSIRFPVFETLASPLLWPVPFSLQLRHLHRFANAGDETQFLYTLSREFSVQSKSTTRFFHHSGSQLFPVSSVLLTQLHTQFEGFLSDIKEPCLALQAWRKFQRYQSLFLTVIEDKRFDPGVDIRTTTMEIRHSDAMTNDGKQSETVNHLERLLQVTYARKIARRWRRYLSGRNSQLRQVGVPFAFWQYFQTTAVHPIVDQHLQRRSRDPPKSQLDWVLTQIRFIYVLALRMMLLGTSQARGHMYFPHLVFDFFLRSYGSRIAAARYMIEFCQNVRHFADSNHRVRVFLHLIDPRTLPGNAEKEQLTGKVPYDNDLPVSFLHALRLLHTDMGGAHYESGRRHSRLFAANSLHTKAVQAKKNNTNWASISLPTVDSIFQDNGSEAGVCYISRERAERIVRLSFASINQDPTPQFMVTLRNLLAPAQEVGAVGCRGLVLNADLLLEHIMMSWKDLKTKTMDQLLSVMQASQSQLHLSEEPSFDEFAAITRVLDPHLPTVVLPGLYRSALLEARYRQGRSDMDLLQTVADRFGVGRWLNRIEEYAEMQTSMCHATITGVDVTAEDVDCDRCILNRTWEYHRPEIDCVFKLLEAVADPADMRKLVGAHQQFISRLEAYNLSKERAAQEVLFHAKQELLTSSETPASIEHMSDVAIDQLHVFRLWGFFRKLVTEMWMLVLQHKLYEEAQNAVDKHRRSHDSRQHLRSSIKSVGDGW